LAGYIFWVEMKRKKLPTDFSMASLDTKRHDVMVPKKIQKETLPEQTSQNQL
jgi:hypothetical protein